LNEDVAVGRIFVRRIMALWIASGLIILNGLSLAQEPAGNKINIQAGINLFPNPEVDSKVYTEFTFSVNRKDFTFMASDSTGGPVRAAIYADIFIFDTLDNIIDSASTYFYTMASDSILARTANVRLFNKLYFMLNPGIYKGKLTVIDVSSKKEGAFLYDRINVAAPDTTKMSLSSLELAYNIRMIDDSILSDNIRMAKNGREVIPNPMGVFSEDDSLIYVYAELYGMHFGGALSGKFQLNYKIYKNDGSLQIDYGYIQLEKPGYSSVLSNALIIKGWPPERYNLTLTATDLETGLSTEKSRRFIIFPKGGVLAKNTGGTQISILDTANLNTLSNLTKFLFSAQQTAIFSSLTDSGKYRFIVQFFKDKDPDPGTPANEYLDDAIRRYDYANKYFSSLPGRADGWHTDRGRVLMQYGEWDNRDEVTAPSYGRPWERWYYRSVQSGILFIFEDASGYGEYRLVHSTAQGEVYNSSWNDKVKDENLEIY
jgi:GWxTD domain-containing protein